MRAQAGLRATLVQRAPEVVTWALALALAAQAALIVARLAGARSGAALPASAALPLPATPRRSLDIAGVVNAHLFGAAPPAAGTGGADAPATNLALVLAGVLASDDPLKGVAILGEAVTSAKVFAVGQSVPGGARLHAVYNDRVILDRNGALEALFLPRQRAAGAPTASAAILPGASPDGALLERMRKLVNEDPSVVGEVLRPQVVSLQGKVRGFRVYPGRNRQAFALLGLRSGDLVTAINGTPLDDTNRGNEIFRTLSSASEAHVTVIRNGQQQDLVLNLSQVAAQAQQLTGAPVNTEGMVPAAQQPPVPPPPQSALPASETTD
jgi:general secretion pathway protein C